MAKQKQLKEMSWVELYALAEAQAKELIELRESIEALSLYARKQVGK